MIAILLGILVFVVAIVLLHPKDDRNKVPPPGPKALPLIGNLHMLGTQPHRTLQALAEKYGPIMFLKLGQVPTVVVSSPEAAKLFLKTHDLDFANRSKFQAVEMFFNGGKGIGMAQYGWYWRHMKKLCTLQLLSGSKVEMYGPLRRKELEMLVKSLCNASASGEVVNLSMMLKELSENITFKMVLGRKHESNRFNLKALVDLVSLAGAFNIADYVPILGIFDFQGIRKKVNKLRKSIDDTLEYIIEDHQNTNYDDDNNSPQKKDFVDILLSCLDQPMDPDEEHEHVITRNDIKAIIMDMIGATYESSTSAIEWVMSELLKHPSVMKKLQHEIQHVVGGINKQVEESEIENMPYLDMVVKETLRLYPVAPLLLPHESRNDVVVDGYYIKKNTRIIINAWAIGRDPRVWSENAEKFYPERFEHDNVDILGRDFRFIPFGSGRRGCPGAQLGFATIKFVVAQLVHCFNWELPFGMSCDELDMNETFGITIPRTTHLLAIPTFRLTAEAASNKE
ncbi:cytochrome P450 CYP736A12-like [Arachis ipaensis]|uniref:Cytochrome P450 n=1 Tax=Arachis hypogaea TaxID=3818 RepID=A0A444Z0A8_ARAHY|nr:cytochrome P450 CYP736A12-like [Arachis ipaensis]XP_025655986.1 cytochrome P450 CYP736A12 [Arachis hypogaea]QHO13383.1 Cytochrome P450 [Arachis hypogaea]RYR07598.1 hypothetical protein Ahy_B05g074989 [Arachis hypogaea]